MYSPYITPNHYHLFFNLKLDFGGRRLDSNEDTKTAFYEEGIEKLISRCDKCLFNGGNYLEK